MLLPPREQDPEGDGVYEGGYDEPVAAEAGYGFEGLVGWLDFTYIHRRRSGFCTRTFGSLDELASN
jgi:hypothetical protein